jgi:FtsH-binding integral membrane protein
MVGCKNYLANTFLHLAGGVGAAAAMSRIPAAEAALNAMGNSGGAKLGLFLGYIVITIGLVIALRIVPVGGITQYSLALVFVFFISQLVKPMLDRLDQKDRLAHVFVLTTGVFAGMAALALFGPVNFLGFGVFLFVGLLGLLLGEIVWMILEMTHTVSGATAKTGNKAFSWIGVALFALFTAYDTQKIKRRAALCRDKGDYINESLSLFLDFLNLFTNFASLQED